jgi:hypothetical protein
VKKNLRSAKAQNDKTEWTAGDHFDLPPIAAVWNQLTETEPAELSAALERKFAINARSEPKLFLLEN